MYVFSIFCDLIFYSRGVDVVVKFESLIVFVEGMDFGVCIFINLYDVVFFINLSC